jgi:O-6-methylguanine DNA methyltransferase
MPSFPKLKWQEHCGPKRTICQLYLPIPGMSVQRPCYCDGRRAARHSQKRSRANSMETLHSTTFTSPVGPLFLAASSAGLVALEFDARLPGRQTIRPNPRDLRAERSTRTGLHFEESESALRPYVSELEEYFAGKRREFTFALDLRGTDFQKACWNALVAIPYGETRSYGDIARAVGRPQGFRAVGMANNRNPIAIVVPCHRVIASDGTLCGYGGGLDLKRKLLELEGALSGTLAA